MKTFSFYCYSTPFAKNNVTQKNLNNGKYFRCHGDVVNRMFWQTALCLSRHVFLVWQVIRYKSNKPQQDSNLQTTLSIHFKIHIHYICNLFYLHQYQTFYILLQRKRFFKRKRFVQFCNKKSHDENAIEKRIDVRLIISLHASFLSQHNVSCF